MNKRALRKELVEVFRNARESISVDECLAEVDKAMTEVEKQRGWSAPNRHRPWSDEELAAVLSDAPTRRNCLRHARALGRTSGAIEQVYRWAATTDATIRSKRPNDSFIKQVKRVAKAVGWV